MIDNTYSEATANQIGTYCFRKIINNVLYQYMKVIVLTDHFGQGGAERVASLIVNGLSVIEGNEVHVCVFEDLNNYNTKVDRVTFHVLADETKGHLVNAWLKIRNLARVIKDTGADVIFSFGPIMAGYVYIAKKLSGCANLKVIDSERNDPRFEPVQNWKKHFRNFCYNRADILVCQTPMAVDLLRNMYGVTTQTEIIPNPITPNLPVWKGVQSKTIITACRLTEQKNLLLLIDAFQLLHRDHPDYSLIIYGDGEQREMLSNYIKAKHLSDNVNLPGFAKNIHDIMSNAYMYVSSSDYEGISNSMLEALGIGLPCVCTDCPVGGAAMYIKNGASGILTKVGDVEGLYLGMKRLIENPSLASDMSNASRRINDELSLPKITGKWVNIVKS